MLTFRRIDLQWRHTDTFVNPSSSLGIGLTNIAVSVLNAFDVMNKFDCSQFSRADGTLKKPSRDAFLGLTRHTGVEAFQTLHIGDELEKYVFHARGQGEMLISEFPLVIIVVQRRPE